MKDYGEIPVIGVGLGRPKKDIPEKWREIIKEEYEMFRPQGSLNLRRAEMPNQAFIRKMHAEVWLGFAIKSFGW